MPRAQPAPGRRTDADGSVDLGHPGARQTGFVRVAATVGRRFRWLLAASFLVHLIFTPLVGWLGWVEQWLENPTTEPPAEELDAIPIDLIDEPDEPEPADPAGLPDKDPVEVIEEILTPPTAPTGTATTKPAPTTPPAPVKTADPIQPKPQPSAHPAKGKDKAPKDAGAPTKKPPRKGQKPTEAGAPRRAPKAPRTIENPVSMAGKAGEIVNSNARLQLIVYTERLRGHVVGERVADLLPRLPQWNDFFGSGVVNPIRDFDRFFVAGTSFYHSDQLVIAMEYNTKRAAIVGAVDALVKREGRWLDDVPVPVARAVADRAERVFVVGEKPVIWIVPPKLQDQALKLRSRRIPRSKGPEALVATIREPSVSLARFELGIPKTVRDVKLRITPLPAGQVRIELSAMEDSAEAAQRAVDILNPRLNALVTVMKGVSIASSLLSLGHRPAVQLPQIELHTRAKEIWTSLMLTQDQALSVVDFIERQMPLAPQPRAGKPKPAESSSSKPDKRNEAAPEKTPKP